MAPFLVILFLLALGVGIVVWCVTDPDLNDAARPAPTPSKETRT